MNRLFSLFIATILISAAPTLAGEMILGGNNLTGGMINDLGGATVKVNNENYAQIGINGNGNVVDWNYMNVGAGKHLDFNFTKAGQVALNKVTGGSMSTFAGQLSTSGEAGKLVISNPAGMLFVDGAVVNANSLTLADKVLSWDGKLNGKISYTGSGKTSAVKTSIKGTANNRVIFNIAEDLNIISINLDVENADLFAGDIRLVTANGVNYVQDGKLAFKNSPEWSSGTLTSNNVTYTIKNNKEGSIQLISGNNGVTYKDKEYTGSSVTNSIFNAPNANSQVVFNNFKTIDNIKVNAGNSVTISSIVSKLFTDTTIKNSEITSQVKISANGATINDSILTSCNTTTKKGAIDARYSTLNNSTLISYGNIDLGSNVSKGLHSTVNNSHLKAVQNGIILNDAEITDSTIDFNQNLNIRNAKLDNTKVTVLTDTLSLTWGEIYLDNTKIINGSEVIGKTLIGKNSIGGKKYIDGLTLENSTLKANRGDINLNGGLINNSNVIARDTNIDLSNVTINGNSRINSNNILKATGSVNGEALDFRGTFAEGTNEYVSTVAPIIEKPVTNEIVSTLVHENEIDRQHLGTTVTEFSISENMLAGSEESYKAIGFAAPDEEMGLSIPELVKTQNNNLLINGSFVADELKI